MKPSRSGSSDSTGFAGKCGASGEAWYGFTVNCEVFCDNKVAWEDVVGGICRGEARCDAVVAVKLGAVAGMKIAAIGV